MKAILAEVVYCVPLGSAILSPGIHLGFLASAGAGCRLDGLKEFVVCALLCHCSPFSGNCALRIHPCSAPRPCGCRASVALLPRRLPHPRASLQHNQWCLHTGRGEQAAHTHSPFGTAQQVQIVGRCMSCRLVYHNTT